MSSALGAGLGRLAIISGARQGGWSRPSSVGGSSPRLEKSGPYGSNPVRSNWPVSSELPGPGAGSS